MGFVDIVKVASIEPAIVLHMVAFKTFYMTLQNIFVDKACRVNLNYPQEICTNLSHRYETENVTEYAAMEAEVQKFVADIIRWKSIIDSFFPLIFVLFLGAWSDRDKHGRKLCICLPIFGYILQTMILIFLLIDEKSSAYSVAVASSLPVALTGSIALFNMAIFTYIADITPIENRTVRSGITNIAYLVGMAMGNAGGGFLSNPDYGFGLEFKKILAISGFLDVLALVWILIVIKNDTATVDDGNVEELEENGHVDAGAGQVCIKSDSSCKADSNAPNTTKNDDVDSPGGGKGAGNTGRGIWASLKEIFNPRNFLDSCKVILKTREGNIRLKLFLLIFPIYFFVTFPEYGEESVNYLYLRFRLNWNLQYYGLFSTYRLLIAFSGNLLAVALLSSILKFSDPFIGIVCCLSQIFACIVYSMAPTTMFMYLGSILGMGSCTISQITKAIIMKIIPTSDIGKVYAFMGCLDAFFPLVAGPLYTTVYKATFQWILPGFYFLMSAAICLVPLSVFMWFFCKRERIVSESELINDVNVEELESSSGGQTQNDEITNMPSPN